jgi:hypothetical protein
MCPVADIRLRASAHRQLPSTGPELLAKAVTKVGGQMVPVADDGILRDAGPQRYPCETQ